MQKGRAPAPYWKVIITLALAMSVLMCKGNDDLRKTALRGEEVYRQYRTADYATARAALLSFISDLEGRLSDPSTPNAETYKADIVLSYARLAKLEEMNNGSDKETYMRQAMSLHKRPTLFGPYQRSV